MGTKKTAPQAEELQQEETQQEEVQNKAEEAPKPEKKKAVIPPEIDNLLRLYPQYERLWVTKQGFVHPEGVSQAYTTNATLYENKYYQS